jgi:hypothetical protein
VTGDQLQEQEKTQVYIRMFLSKLSITDSDNYSYLMFAHDARIKEEHLSSRQARRFSTSIFVLLLFLKKSVQILNLKRGKNYNVFPSIADPNPDPLVRGMDPDPSII